MKSLVTGGAGFIGSNQFDKLVKLGHKPLYMISLQEIRISVIKNIINFIRIVK